MMTGIEAPCRSSGVAVLRMAALFVGVLCLGPIPTLAYAGHDVAGTGAALQASRDQHHDHMHRMPRTRDVGLLRLRGAGQGPASLSGKRSREPAAAYTDEDSEGEAGGGIPRQWWGQAPKRARSGGLVSSALSASYSVATLPFNLAYMACAAVAAAPSAGINWLFPPAPKRPLSDEQLLQFSGDEDKPSAILRQIKFYFSDSNLPFDTFLKGEIAKDSWGRVNLAVIAGFKRMRILNATVEDIALAAASVSFLEVVHLCFSLGSCVPVPLPSREPFAFHSLDCWLTHACARRGMMARQRLQRAPHMCTGKQQPATVLTVCALTKKCTTTGFRRWRVCAAHYAHS